MVEQHIQFIEADHFYFFLFNQTILFWRLYLLVTLIDLQKWRMEGFCVFFEQGGGRRTKHGRAPSL